MYWRENRMWGVLDTNICTIQIQIQTMDLTEFTDAFTFNRND